MAEKPTISFDAQGRVRVLDAEQFRKTEELESECRTFVSSGCPAWALRLRVALSLHALSRPLDRDPGVFRERTSACAAAE